MRIRQPELRGPYINKTYKGINLKLDPDTDKEMIEFLQKKKDEGMSMSGYLRKLIREDMRKEKHGD